MGRHDSKRRARVRALLGAAGVTTVLALSGCSGQGARFGLLPPASDRAPYMEKLWVGGWIASLVVGVITWGLIFYAIIRWRRRSGDAEAPRQTKYHLPLELLYTLVPFLIIGVLFFYTVRTQNNVLKKDAAPQHTIHVVGQKWSWTFNYLEASNPTVGTTVHETGTITKIPDVYLPVGQTVRFNITSADVDHSFWVPAFYFKLDAIPGHPNSFDITPTKIGVFDGKCAELCGTYHARMLFTVHVVSVDDYYKHLQELKTQGQTGELNGPVAPSTIPSGSTEEGK